MFLLFFFTRCVNLHLCVFMFRMIKALSINRLLDRSVYWEIIASSHLPLNYAYGLILLRIVAEDLMLFTCTATKSSYYRKCCNCPLLQLTPSSSLCNRNFSNLDDDINSGRTLSLNARLVRSLESRNR